MINLKINNIPVSVEEGTTILQAAKKVGIKIPSLCYLKEINAIGACRVCVVEVKGARNLCASCVYPVAEGMEVLTNSPKVRKNRKITLELILSDHQKNCLSCVRNLNCELQKLSYEYGCDQTAFVGAASNYPTDTSAIIQRNNNKCVLCRRCEAACKKQQEVAVIGAIKRGFETHIGCAFDSNLADNPCVSCGQCINACPTGALTEKEEIDDVLKAIYDDEKIVIVGSAPSVRAALGEEFGYPIGSNVEGKMTSALRLLNFDKVFDVNFAADLTIMEEANELLDRVKNGGVLPMFTSCSPGWINYLEIYYPELIPNLSSCKSPQQMFGATIKTFYAERMKIDPKNIFVVGVMPCTAKKGEKGRADQSASGFSDIDAVLTTRELAKMIKQSGILFNELPDGEFDNPLGEFSGAGVIFGATGGVMEAALRTAADALEGKSLDSVDYQAVRGIDGIKEASVNVGGITVNVCVASGLSNAKKVCEMVKNGEANYHFIEIMCCPGGCVNGGGQPIVDGDTRNNIDVRSLRANALYTQDKNSKFRKSHDNPAIKEIYDTYFGKPGSHKAHDVLHTKYDKQNKY